MSWSPQPAPGRYAIQIGRIFDGVGTQYRHHLDVHIENGRIAAVVGRGLAPLPDKVIEANDLTLLPGFVDLHTHPTDLAGERLGRTWLFYGVTTIQDVGPDAAEAIARGQAWAAGRSIGPRVIHAQVEPAVGAVGVGRPGIGLAGIDLLANGQPLAGGTSFARLFGSGPASLGYTARGASARAPGFMVRVSPLGRAYQDAVSLLARSGQTFIPTLAALSEDRYSQMPTREIQAYQDLFGPHEHPPLAGDPGDAAQAMSALATAVLAAGGRIGVGSDAPAVPFGLGLHAEMALLSEFGMPNDQILRAATSGGALALGLDGQLGAIEAGKLADFVVVRGDPLLRITDSLSIVAVIRNGHWIDRAALLRPGTGSTQAD